MSFQTGNHAELRLLYVLPGDHELEWQLHRRLKDSRLRGEWFAGPKIEAFLAFVEDLADRMVGAYAGDGQAPHYRDFGSWYRTPRKPEVVVTFVEPDPVPEDEAKRRLAAHWMRPARQGPKGSHLPYSGDATAPGTGTIN